MTEALDIYDRTAALASVGGDREFLWEISSIARAAWPTLLRDIREALESGDLHSVERAAHLVKVTTQSVFAKRAYLAALLLETMAGYREIEGALEASAGLEEEIERLEPFLAMPESAVDFAQH